MSKIIGWLIAALAIAFIILSKLNCNKVDVVPVVDKQKDSLFAVIVEANNAVIEARKETVFVRDSSTAVINSLRKARSADVARLEISGKLITDLNNEYKAAKAQKDTLEQLVKCDSISTQYAILTDLYFVQRDKTDSLLTAYTNYKLFADTTMRNQQEDYDSLYDKTLAAGTLYDKKKAEDAKLLRKADRRSFFGWVAAIIAGVLLALKK